MKAVTASFATGSLFALGLALSGMTKPSKVIGFLDLFGAWDASLAFVMIGAIGVHAIAYRLIMRRRSPLLDVRFHLPVRRDVDLRLIFGSALFGIGWGLGGYCPGPGLVAAASGATSALVFVLGMTAGMKLEHLWDRPPRGRRSGASAAPSSTSSPSRGPKVGGGSST